MVSLWTRDPLEVIAEGKVLGKVLVDYTPGGVSDPENNYIGTVYTTPRDGPGVDAFVRQRVSNPVTLFESSMEIDDQPLLWDTQTTGTGATSYVTNNSSVSLSVSSASSSALRQSHQYIRYQPGKSLLVYFSFAFDVSVTDLTRRVGLFDANNGVFLEQNDGGVYWVLRSYTNGSVTETKIEQNDWNLNTWTDFDPTKSNICVIDLEWLGVGRVRCGFVYDGQILYTHEFLYANREGDTVYMTRASLPIRYEITSGISFVAASADLTQICSTVISEGGYEPKGMIRSTSNGISLLSVSPTSAVPLLAIRLRSAYNKASLTLINMDIYSTETVHYEVIYRANVTGGTWVQVSEAVVANVSATVVSGGYIVSSGYVDKRASVVSSELEGTNLVNSSDIGGTSDIIVVTAQSVTGNVQTGASFQWREIF